MDGTGEGLFLFSLRVLRFGRWQGEGNIFLPEDFETLKILNEFVF
jgi:hypothetical protein